MFFAIRKNARDWWFAKIKGQFEVDFDIFYFCFIAGIAKDRKASFSGSDVVALVENFPGRYKDRGALLVSLFLSRELKSLGVTLNDKQAIRSQISNLVRHNVQNYLSDEGVREFNKYAHGGFDVLQEWFEDRPRSLDTFLRIFHQKVRSCPGWTLLD